MKKHISLFFILFFTLTNGIAQKLSFSIEGKITDAETRQPIPGASVEIAGSDGALFSTVSDDTGFYRFDSTRIKENSTYRIAVSAKDYLAGGADETTAGAASANVLVRNFELKKQAPCTFQFPVLYYDSSAVIPNAASREHLEEYVRVLNANPGLVIEVSGYCDSLENSKKLSRKRADEVKKILTGKGIDADRIFTVGYGYIPKKTDCRDAGMKEGKMISEAYISSLPEEEKKQARGLNRRVDYKILQVNYRKK